VGARRESRRLIGTGIGGEHSAIGANENCSPTTSRIESAEEIFEVLDPNLNPDDAVEVAGEDDLRQLSPNVPRCCSPTSMPRLPARCARNSSVFSKVRPRG
jgi:hypothetical protein